MRNSRECNDFNLNNTNILKCRKSFWGKYQLPINFKTFIQKQPLFCEEGVWHCFRELFKSCFQRVLLNSNTNILLQNRWIMSKLRRPCDISLDCKTQPKPSKIILETIHSPHELDCMKKVDISNFSKFIAFVWRRWCIKIMKKCMKIEFLKAVFCIWALFWVFLKHRKVQLSHSRSHPNPALQFQELP